MNSKPGQTNVLLTPTLLRTLTAGISEGYYGEPWREYSRCQDRQQNYEQARLYGIACRTAGIRLPARITGAWIDAVWQHFTNEAFAADRAGPFAECKRPPHLIQADLNASLEAAGLSSLRSPQEEVY